VAAKDDKKKTASEDLAKPGFDPKPKTLGDDSIVDRLLPYKKQIAVAVALGLVAWGVIAMVFYFRNRKREKNTTHMAEVLDVASRRVLGPGEQPAAAGSGEDQKPEQTFANSKERADAVLAEMQKSHAKFPASYKASLLVQAGKLDEAIAEYRTGLDAKGLDGVLAREGLGLALEMKAQAEKDAATRQKGLEEALAVFQQMQPDEKGPRRAYALYHQGRILSLLGKTAEATDAFKKAKEAGGEGAPLNEQIDERLASLGAS
jgi:tetratricopeptide (TPR) repeat protein